MRTDLRRPRHWSITTRITLTSTALLAIALIVAAVALAGIEKRSLVREIDSSLDDRVAGLVDDVTTGQLSLEPAVKGRPADLPLTGRESGVVQIIDSDGSIVAATPGLGRRSEFGVVSAPVGRTAHVTVRTALGQEAVETWRVAAQRLFDRPPNNVDIFVATDLTSVDNTTARLRSTLLIGLPLLIAAFAVIARMSIIRSLAPVERVTERVDEMSASDVGGHLPEIKTGDQIAHLVKTFNGLLDRVSDARARERRFAADASHELRTPITTARLNLEIAQANPTPESLRQAVDDTMVEVERLEVLARDLLELTRLDASRVRSSAVAFDLAGLVRHELTTLAKAHPELTFVAPVATVVEASGDPALVVRVVRNLLENAARHAASRVETSVAAVRGIGDRLGRAVVSVHNNGPAIAPGDRQRVFEAFTRLDDARTRYEDGGTGLGLAIAADIVKAHGGEIEVMDDDRPGATFRFTLPLPLDQVAETTSS